MTNLLLDLSNLSTPLMAVTSEAADTLAAPGKIGLTLIAIIIVPVAVLILASLLSAPRRSKIPGLFIGSVILLIGATISFLAILSVVLKLVVPQ